MATDPRHLCRICRHPDRAAIELATLNRKSFRSIARDFRLGSSRGAEFTPDHKIVSNHVQRHMAEAYQEALRAGEIDSGVAIATRLGELNSYLDEVIERARAGAPVMQGDAPLLSPDGSPVTRHDDRLLLAAVREARANAEVQARMAGALPEGEEGAVDEARRALQDPAARRMLADLEAHLAGSDSGA